MDAPPDRKIVINGKEYASADEMPPDIRAVYERALNVLADRDANGVPDVLEGKGGGVFQTLKQVWGIARDARSAGIESVTLPKRMPGTPAKTAGAASRPPAAPKVSVSLPVGTHPLEPTALGTSGFGGLLFWSILAAGVYFVASHFGWIS